MQFESFGNLVQYHRQALGLTQAELREVLLQGGIDVSVSSISAWELGVNYPRRRHLEAVLEVLQVADKNAARTLYTSGETVRGESV